MPEGLLNGLRPQEVPGFVWVFAERGEVGKKEAVANYKLGFFFDPGRRL